MPAITIDLDQEQIDRAQKLADRLTVIYGTKVSRASVIRRAIMAFEPDEIAYYNADGDPDVAAYEQEDQADVS